MVSSPGLRSGDFAQPRDPKIDSVMKSAPVAMSQVNSSGRLLRVVDAVVRRRARTMVHASRICAPTKIMPAIQSVQVNWRS